jgi:hypothetical protein
MRVGEAVQHMTKAYLHRIIDSFTRDLVKPDEDRSREIIVRNTEELTDPERIQTVLRRESLFSDQILDGYILDSLVNRPDHRASEEEVINEVQALEQGVIEDASKPDALKYEDRAKVEIFKAVLEVALEDQQVSAQELNLIRRLREKLGIHEKTKRVLLAQLGHFPRTGNRIHSSSELRNALIDLQKRGVVFYCNKLDGGQYVLPEEIVSSVKKALGVEMSRKGWVKLLEHLSADQLGTILESAGLPKSGRKADLQERIRVAGLPPSESLGRLATDDLYSILSSLPGAKVSGSKNDRIARIIEYFDKMIFKEVPDEVAPGELFYRYFVELAARDREILLANKVIRKDREMEGAFEEATKYLFGEKLGLDFVALEGSDRPDGCIALGGRRDDIMMWDNKSKESIYEFPPSHLRQFKRYIRDSAKRVACFLVIVPSIADNAAHMAARLKVESGTDTDVALITAEDLLWTAEHWAERGNGTPFTVEVFNATGILNRETLKQRIRLFL